MTGKNNPFRRLGSAARPRRRPEWAATGHGRRGARRAGRRAFVAGGADPLRRLGFDQFLHDHPDRLADQVDTFTHAELVKELGHGRRRTWPSSGFLGECLAVHTKISPMGLLHG
jgi:hypothetical protein